MSWFYEQEIIEANNDGDEATVVPFVTVTPDRLSSDWTIEHELACMQPAAASLL